MRVNWWRFGALSARYICRARADEAETVRAHSGIRTRATDVWLPDHRGNVEARMAFGFSRKRLSTPSGDRKGCNCFVVKWKMHTLELNRQAGCASPPNQVWTYDFLEGRTERAGKAELTVLDEYNRECL